MKKVLLIGSTGQLGTKVFEKLTESGKYDTRILVREDSQYEHLKAAEPEIVFGDLSDKASIRKAVEGVDVIITTANAVAPRKKEDTFKSVDTEGYQDLISLAKEAGVKQFIYTSAYPFNDKLKHWIPLTDAKDKTENYLKGIGMNYTILQPDAFMDVYFAFMGSSLPVEGEIAPLVNRPWKFMQNFYNGVKDDIENGQIDMIGDGQARHSFIAIDNVADFLVKAIDHPDMINVTQMIGGPQALSGMEVKSIFEKVLNKPLKIKKTPAVMMKVMGNVFSLFNKPASNIFKLNYANATESSVFDTSELAEKLGVELISAEGFLNEKIEAIEKELVAK